MIASYQKLTNQNDGNSFADFWVRENSFGVHWHYHPEVEICYIKKGDGHRIVGDSIERFDAGDLVLVGSNLPHCWTSSEVFKASPLDMEVYVIQFIPTSVLTTSVEFQAINNLINEAKKGIKFDVQKTPMLKSILKDISKSEGMVKYLNLLRLLQLMAQTGNKEYLVSKLYAPDYSKKAERRIEKVCNYINDNYREQIALGDLSNLASMNTSSFCRFFKKCIGKTIIEYINELRIDYATHQLKNSSLSISSIAFDSGYQTLTQFNKIFKRLKHTTPSVYRKDNQRTLIDFI